jgi:hypothetical protein
MATGSVPVVALIQMNVAAVRIIRRINFNHILKRPEKFKIHDNDVFIDKYRNVCFTGDAHAPEHLTGNYTIYFYLEPV